MIFKEYTSVNKEGPKVIETIKDLAFYAIALLTFHDYSKITSKINLKTTIVTRKLIPEPQFFY